MLNYWNLIESEVPDLSCDVFWEKTMGQMKTPIRRGGFRLKGSGHGKKV
jgi:hypothetical protein